jgi:hypothetical protein
MKAKTGRKTRKTGMSKESREAEIQALWDDLDAWKVDKTPEEIAALMALHDGYHGQNPLLIAMQDPEATDVDAFKAWKERGRTPIGKGQAIYVTFPVLVKVPDPDNPGQTKEIPVSFGKTPVYDVRFTIPDTPEARKAWKDDHPEDENKARHWRDGEDYKPYDRFQGIVGVR